MVSDVMGAELVPLLNEHGMTLESPFLHDLRSIDPGIDVHASLTMDGG